MQYQIYRATFASGSSGVSKIERLNHGNWTETDLSKAGKYVVPLIHASTVAVDFPSALDGTNLRFKTTYDPNLLAQSEAGDVAGAAIELTGVDSWKGKNRTCPAELISRAYFEPVLTDTSGVAQTQSQQTVLVFTLKAPTGPNA